MIDQNVCDRIIQHVCKHKPYAPYLLAIYAEHIETVYCSIADQKCILNPLPMPRQYELLFAAQFHEMMKSKGRPLYLAQAGVVSLANEVGNPTMMHVCITDIDGKENISYMAKMKSCLCCYDTLTHTPNWKGATFMLGEVVKAFRPAPAPVFPPYHQVKFSNN